MEVLERGSCSEAPALSPQVGSGTRGQLLRRRWRASCCRTVWSLQAARNPCLLRELPGKEAGSRRLRETPRKAAVMGPSAEGNCLPCAHGTGGCEPDGVQGRTQLRPLRSVGDAGDSETGWGG